MFPFSVILMMPLHKEICVGTDPLPGTGSMT